MDAFLETVRGYGEVFEMNKIPYGPIAQIVAARDRPFIEPLGYELFPSGCGRS